MQLQHLAATPTRSLPLIAFLPPIFLLLLLFLPPLLHLTHTPNRAAYPTYYILELRVIIVKARYLLVLLADTLPQPLYLLGLLLFGGLQLFHLGLQFQVAGFHILNLVQD